MDDYTILFILFVTFLPCLFFLLFLIKPKGKKSKNNNIESTEPRIKSHNYKENMVKVTLYLPESTYKGYVLDAIRLKDRSPEERMEWVLRNDQRFNRRY